MTASTSDAGEDHPPFVIDREGLIARFNASPALMKKLLSDPQLNGRVIDEEDQGRRRPPRE